MRAPTKKGEKERKDKGKEKKSDKMTEQEQCFIKLWETLEKMQAIGDIIVSQNYGKLGKKMQAIGDIVPLTSACSTCQREKV